MYQVHPVIGVIDTQTGEHIKPRSGNPKWDEYREWLHAGNVPEPQPTNEEPLDKILERKLGEVQNWLEVQHNSPIEVDGHWFDADSAARENISGTLARLWRSETLPALWVGWRTYNNDMVWVASTPAEVKVALAAVAEAIEDRKQDLMIQSWQKKAQLHALFDASNRAELLNFRAD